MDACLHYDTSAKFCVVAEVTKEKSNRLHRPAENSLGGPFSAYTPVAHGSFCYNPFTGYPSPNIVAKMFSCACAIFCHGHHKRY